VCGYAADAVCNVESVEGYRSAEQPSALPGCRMHRAHKQYIQTPYAGK
jgi:hypothetical protein